MRYFKITLEGGSSYIQPMDKLDSALDGELDGLDYGERITLHFEHIPMTDEEYKLLPDFLGH